MPKLGFLGACTVPEADMTVVPRRSLADRRKIPDPTGPDGTLESWVNRNGIEAA